MICTFSKDDCWMGGEANIWNRGEKASKNQGYFLRPPQNPAGLFRSRAALGFLYPTEL